MRENLPTNLKDLLRQRGISQTELAEALGVSKGTLSDWISGRFYPRPKYIEALAEYFNVDAAELQANKKNPPSTDSELMIMYEALSPEKKEQVKDYITFLLRSRK